MYVRISRSNPYVISGGKPPASALLVECLSPRTFEVCNLNLDCWPRQQGSGQAGSAVTDLWISLGHSSTCHLFSDNSQRLRYSSRRRISHILFFIEYFKFSTYIGRFNAKLQQHKRSSAATRIVINFNKLQASLDYVTLKCLR